ncbi:MAG: ABC transporter substrate-binding protein [Acidaminococcales bacterium]|nr:ABC transporter substrate-binding protein [Acidaminococcales bacterium]
MAAGCGGGNTSSPAAKPAAPQAPATGIRPPDTLTEKGYLTFGTISTFPPFEYMKDGKLVGFDVDLVDALAKEMGLKAKNTVMNFDGLIPALQGGRFDMIVSGMYIKPERREMVDFIGYMKLSNVIVTRKGDNKGIKSMDDLSGKKVAVVRAGYTEILCREQNKRLAELKKPLIDILLLPTENDVVLATEQGRADAFLHSAPGAAHLSEQKPNVFEVPVTMPPNAEIGIATRKGNDKTRAALEAAVKKLVADGTYEKLMQKYHLPPELNYFK